MTNIEKVAVIGAGVMGAGIAAHVANSGTPVVLLDVVPNGASKRSVLAETAIKNMLKANPAPLMHKQNVNLIKTGNIDDDLGMLAECDLIIEAVIENLEIKQALYKQIDTVRKAGSIITSNTSTIPLAKLMNGLTDDFARDFAITHFFNPPRYLRLLEVVAGPHTRTDAITALQTFCDRALGKSVVHCKDTPGFIANRIGILWTTCAIRFAFEDQLTVEEADAIVGRPMGIPKTGVFGLMDLVGIDLQPHVSASMLSSLPSQDMFRDLHQDSEFIAHMIREGYTGRKGKGGFYRLNRSKGQRIKESLDLQTGEYRTAQKADLASISAGRKGLRALVEHPDKGGHYAWRVLAHTLSYAASLVPEIADDVFAVDEAMRNGYAWKWGPFEMIDQLGPAWFATQLREFDMTVPKLLAQIGAGSFYRTEQGVLQYFGTDNAYHNVPRPDGVLLLQDIKRATTRVAGNGSASLWDIGDGVVCLEFHTKMNSIDPGIMTMVEKTLKVIRAENYKALVIHNEAANFSVGANIGLALFAANIAGWPEITKSVKAGQDVYKALKYSPFPVVGAPSGMALAGGLEILLHCDAVQAHAETYMGLVEVGVGLVPAWGGCKEMLARWQNNPEAPGGPMPAVTRVFETVGTAAVSRSAVEAQDFLYLRDGDGITMNQDRLLAEAKARAQQLADDYTPPEPTEYALPGPTAATALTMVVNDYHRAGKATDHDVTVGKALAWVLSGGKTDITETITEDHLLSLERRTIVELLKTTPTLDRIEHMLETGKPLRN